MDEPPYRFDPVDLEMVRLRACLTPARRLMAMLAAREWVVSAIRSRLRRRFPELSAHQINLLMLEEIERAERREAGAEPLP